MKDSIPDTARSSNSKYLPGMFGFGVAERRKPRPDIRSGMIMIPVRSEENDEPQC